MDVPGILLGETWSIPLIVAAEGPLVAGVDVSSSPRVVVEYLEGDSRDHLLKGKPAASTI